MILARGYRVGYMCKANILAAKKRKYIPKSRDLDIKRTCILWTYCPCSCAFNKSTDVI